MHAVHQRNQPTPLAVMPAKAGIQQRFDPVDSRLRGNDNTAGRDSI